MDEQLGREREESSLSWECEFRVPENLQEQAEGRSGGQGSQWTVLMLFDDFKPTYRGREFKDAKPLDVSGIRRMSLMMRRYVFAGSANNYHCLSWFWSRPMH